MVDRAAESLVIGPRTQAANFPAAPVDRLLNARCQLFHAAAVVYAGQCVQQPLIGLLRHFGTAMQIGDAFPQGPPLKILFRPALFRPECPEVSDRVNGGFRSSQHAADLAVRLVVEFGRVAIHPLLDSLALRAAFPIRF